MFDRETRRAKVLEARGRAKRDARGKAGAPAGGEVNKLGLSSCLIDRSFDL